MEKSWIDKNFYSILGVSESATPEEIKKKYRSLAREYHPDANKDNPGAEEKFKEISEAYDVLSNAEKKQEYDQVRQMSSSGFFNNEGRFSAENIDFDTFNLEDLFNSTEYSDFFGNIFGTFGNMGSAGSRAQNLKGSDIESMLTLSFEESLMGVSKTFTLQAEIPCNECGGRGLVYLNNKRMPCPQCNGEGSTIFSDVVNVRIPAGVKNEDRIKIKGKGTPNPYGVNPGDLFLTVQVKKHPFFSRKDDDILLTIPVSFPEAVLGCEIQVPIPKGLNPNNDSTIKIKIPPGTGDGTIFRIKGKGFNRKKKQGNLLVTVQVSVPKKLSKKAQEAIETYAAETLDYNPRTFMFEELQKLAEKEEENE
jgi:molecular chaperone DnaJ